MIDNDTPATPRFLPNFPKFHLGMIVEGCNLHIGPIIDFAHHDSVVIRSLFNGEESVHSIRHCGVEIQTYDDIIHKMNIYKEGGMPFIKRLFELRMAEQDRIRAEQKKEREGSGKPYWITIEFEGEITFEGHQAHWADCFFSNATRADIEHFCQTEQWGTITFREMTEEELTKYPEALEFQKSLVNEYGEY